jgi:hypothetical protein
LNGEGGITGNVSVNPPALKKPEPKKGFGELELLMEIYALILLHVCCKKQKKELSISA